MSLVSAQLPQTSVATIAMPNLQTQDAPIDEPIVVTAANGRLTDVQVTNGPNKILKGTLSPDGRTWTSIRPTLDFGETYKISASAVDSRGESTSASNEFTTLKPDGFAGASFSNLYGTTWGVGMPITVDFDQPEIGRAHV